MASLPPPRREACIQAAALRSPDSLESLTASGQMERLARRLREADTICPEEAENTLDRRIEALMLLGDIEEATRAVELTPKEALKRSLLRKINAASSGRNCSRGYKRGNDTDSKENVRRDFTLRCLERTQGETARVVPAEGPGWMAFRGDGLLEVQTENGGAMTVDPLTGEILTRGVIPEITQRFPGRPEYVDGQIDPQCPAGERCGPALLTPGQPYLVFPAVPFDGRNTDADKGKLRIREKTSGKLLATLENPEDPSRALIATSQDGAWLAIVPPTEGASLYLWSTKKGGAPLRRSSDAPTDHSPGERTSESRHTLLDKRVDRMEFSYDRRWLITALSDGLLRLFPTAPGPVRSKRFPRLSVTDVAVAKDGAIFLALEPTSKFVGAPEGGCFRLNLSDLSLQPVPSLRGQCGRFLSNRGAVFNAGNSLLRYTAGEFKPTPLPTGTTYKAFEIQGGILRGTVDPIPLERSVRIDGSRVFLDGTTTVVQCEGRALYARRQGDLVVALCEKDNGLQRILAQPISPGARPLQLFPIMTPSRASFLAQDADGRVELLGPPDEVHRWRENLFCSLGTWLEPLALCEGRLVVPGLWSPPKQ